MRTFAFNYYGTLFKDLRKCRKYRKNYYIKPDVKVVLDNRLFVLLPTIMVQPWVYRHPDSYVFELRWLGVRVGIGLFLYKRSDNNGE